MVSRTEILLEPSTPERDAELCQALLAGDNGAAAELYRRFLPAIKYFGERALANYNEGNPAISLEDLTQEAVEEILRIAQTYKSKKGNSLNGMFALSMSRLVSRFSKAEISEEAYDFYSIDGDDESPTGQEIKKIDQALWHTQEDNTIILDDYLDKLNCLVSKLSERHSDIVQKAYGLNGTTPMTHRQIAELFGINEVKVDEILTEARNLMRNAYNNPN